MSIRDVEPVAVWHELSTISGSFLLDVRTRAEWQFVGVPNLSQINSSPLYIEWRTLPNMHLNDNFATELLTYAQSTSVSLLFFLCRSGVRSQAAAQFMGQFFSQTNLTIECANVAKGFEGDRDDHAHRGFINGWKASGLPWQQQ